MYGCGGKYRGSSPNLAQLVRARGLEHLRPYSCKKYLIFIHFNTRMWDCTESRLTGRKPPILCWLVYFVLKVWFVSPVYRSWNERLGFYYYKSCTKEQKCKIFFLTFFAQTWEAESYAIQIKSFKFSTAYVVMLIVLATSASK